MFDDTIAEPPPAHQLPLDEAGAAAVQRLGRWMRVVGTIQLALAGIALVFLMIGFSCGFALAGPVGMAAVLFGAVIPLGIAGVFLLQALRTQASGEQFGNLAEHLDLDYLELAFVRLKTVYIIDVVVGALLIVNMIGGGS